MKTGRQPEQLIRGRGTSGIIFDYGNMVISTELSVNQYGITKIKIYVRFSPVSYKFQINFICKISSSYTTT